MYILFLGVTNRIKANNFDLDIIILVTNNFHQECNECHRMLKRLEIKWYNRLSPLTFNQ